MSNQERLYVIARKDIARPQRTVQAIHAALCLLSQHPEIAANWDDIGPSLIVYGVTGAQLKRLAPQLTQPSVLFREPDWNLALTAAAYYGRKLEPFGELNLL